MLLVKCVTNLFVGLQQIQVLKYSYKSFANNIGVIFVTLNYLVIIFC